MIMRMLLVLILLMVSVVGRSAETNVASVKAQAEHGNAIAQVNLGVMYAQGKVVQQDYVQAAAWFHKAADQGLAEGQYALGSLYFNGQGVPQDYVQAVAWFRKAADQGYAMAQSNLSVMYLKGQGVAQDNVQAATWVRKAADQGAADAQYALGFMYFKGQGVLQDYIQSVAWFRKAADQGYAMAQTILGVIYLNGKVVQQDYVQAAAWYRKAADQGLAEAQYELGVMYDEGRGVPQDHRQAVVWYRKAADQDNAFAKTELNRLIAHGYDTRQDNIKSCGIPLGAHGKLVDFQESGPAYEAAKVATLEDIARARKEEESLKIKASFIGRKGRDSVLLVYFDGAWFCGSGGCQLEAYRIENNKWIDLRLNQLSGEAVYIYNADKTNPDILFSSTFNESSWVLKYDEKNRRYESCSMKDVQEANSKISEPKMRSPSTISKPPPPQVAALSPPTPIPTSPPKFEEHYSGSGYAIDTTGKILTNYHVVEGCKLLKLRRGERAVTAEVVATDQRNDLAVIVGPMTGLGAVKFRDGRDIRAADGVVALGYPYAGLLAKTPQTTTGNVTALAGIDDDNRFLQISAPIQPGNSGGPLFDLSGNVVGIVDATLDPLIMAKATGSIPQNINFAIKVGIIREFLDGKGIAYLSAPSTIKKDPADVSEAGAKSVVLVECTK